METASVSQAAQMAVAEAVHQEERAEVAEATTAAVIASASAAIDNANERAAEIAEAAMNTEIGRRVGELEGKFTSWQEVADRLQSLVTDLGQRLETLAGQIAGLATVTVATALPSSQSTPPPSEMTEALTTAAPLTEVLPETLTEIVQDESTPAAPEAPKRRTRFL